MKTNLKQCLFAALAIVVIGLSACSKDNPVTPDEEFKAQKGMYILNEGSIGANNSSLSYLDFITNNLFVNVFSQVNTSSTLGDNATDMDIYGNLIFISVTESDKVEILNATTAKIVKTVSIKKPRFIAFHAGKAFITSYENKVFVIDTTSRSVVDEVSVGRSPEQIVVSGGKLYVANSGSQDGWSNGNYDRTVSVIDPVTMTEEKIEVAENVYHMFADDRGNIYVSTQDIFAGTWPDLSLEKPSRLYRINTQTKAIHKYEFGSRHLAFYQNAGYIVSTNYENQDGVNNFLELDLTNNEIKRVDYFKGKNFSNVYGLAVNRENGNIWVSDTDYTNPGTIYRYEKKTSVIQQFTIGTNPSAFAFFN